MKTKMNPLTPVALQERQCQRAELEQHADRVTTPVTHLKNVQVLTHTVKS